MRYSVAILAGGKSRRMGQNKALLQIGNKTVLSRMVDVVRPLTDDLFLVTNAPQLYQDFQLSVVGDLWPGQAALAGVYTAIMTAVHEWVLVLACDMPLIDPRPIRFLAGLLGPDDVISPRIGPYPETLHTFYRKTCLTAIEHNLATNQFKVADFFSRVKVKYVEAAALSPVISNFDFLTNMNTPDDLEKVVKIISNRPAG